MKMFRKKDEGFTLVELMVVVLIIGILVAIAIPVFNSARANAERRACFANQRTINGAVQTFRATYEIDPADGTVDANHALIAGQGTDDGLIKVAPACPTVKAATPPGLYVLALGTTTCPPPSPHGSYTD